VRGVCRSFRFVTARPLAAGLLTCIYCGQPARSREHIVATRFIDVLREDPRGLPLPVMLTATLPDGTRRRIGGKKTKRGKYTLEYTTRVCANCNSGWMNRIDDAAFPSVADMVRGKQVSLDGAARAAIAAWMCKVAVTARSAPHSPLPIERDWTDWLYTHHSAPPTWYVWIGRYEGTQPWWYQPHDVRIELGPGSASPPPGMNLVRPNGVLATLVIGYLIAQVFGVSGLGQLQNPDREVDFPLIWPGSTDLVWPPPHHIDDAGLPRWGERLLYQPSLPLSAT